MQNTYRSSIFPPNLFKKNWTSLIFLILFSFILTYALSGIVYFTNLIATTGTANKYEFGVVIQNLLFAIISVFVVWLFIIYLDFKIKNTWFKYLLIFLAIEFIVMFASWFLYEAIWKDLGEYRRNGSPAIDIGMQAALIPGFVGIIYYYFWKKSQKINQKIDEQELQLLQLAQNKTKAELAALEARINPHFLYNSLNSIASLIYEKPDLAEEMTLKLSNLFRKTTKRDNATFYSLAEEMEIVKTYLEIEQIRFGTKLKYETHVNNDCLNVQVPKFIIQPLVENAIKHGTSKITENGFINVTAKCLANKLQISVHDNGPHFNITESAGYGLTSIQEKIKLIYGKNGELSIQNSPEKLITISIPYEKV